MPDNASNPVRNPIPAKIAPTIHIYPAIFPTVFIILFAWLNKRYYIIRMYSFRKTETIIYDTQHNGDITYVFMLFIPPLLNDRQKPAYFHFLSI